MLFAAKELKPLGFEYEDVWSVRLSQNQSAEEYQHNVELVWRELQESNGVEAVALASEAPFRFPNAWEGITSVYISEEGMEVLGPRMLSGRWFQPGTRSSAGRRQSSIRR